MRNLQIAFIALTLSSACAAVEPCDTVEQKLANNRRVDLAHEAASQLHVSDAKILRSFRLQRWNILEIDTSQSDDVFLFYSGDPLVGRYITMWSGAARSDEEPEIRTWVLTNAPGIPLDLANCFAWYVTKGRAKATMETGSSG